MNNICICESIQMRAELFEYSLVSHSSKNDKTTDYCISVKRALLILIFGCWIPVV